MYSRYLNKLWVVFIVSGFLILGTQTQTMAQPVNPNGPGFNEEKRAAIKKHMKDAVSAMNHLRSRNKSFQGTGLAKTKKQFLSKDEEELILEMKNQAKIRRQALEDLIGSDPEMALEIAITPEERAQFPTEVQEELEEHVDLEGELEVVIMDNFEERVSTIHHTLVAGENQYTLYFAEQSPDLMSSPKVKVKGLRAGKRIAIPGEGGQK